MSKYWKIRFPQFVLLTMLLCILLPVAAMAQSTTQGAIGGTVTDQSKAVVPNAKVTVLNVGTQQQKTATTDGFGGFRVMNLDPGTYQVTVDAASFAPWKASQVTVEVGRVTQLEATLSATGKAETVEVTGEAPAVNTLQQDFSSNINQEAINNLPINGRRWSSFALLTPGATPDGNYGLISFRGISGLLNNNTVDGGDNNQAFFSEEKGRTRISYVVSQAAVREFQVNTSNYSAEYGRAAGGVVNAVTKSGTNKFHGEGFYYLRDNTLGATNPFSTHTVQNPDGSYSTVPFKPTDRRQQFGGNLGGPIIKDKLFFFFNYDGQRRNFPGVAIPGTPNVFFQALQTSELNTLKTRMGPGTTDAQATAIFNTGMTFLNAETGPVPRTGDQNILFPKLDWKISPNHTVTLSYNRMRWASPAGIQTQATNTYATNSFGNDYVKADTFITRLNSIFGNNITNEFRYQWGRDFEFETSQVPTAGETQYNLNTGYGNRPPAMYISSGGGFSMGRPTFLERAAYPDERRNQFANTTSWAVGKHLVKFGFDINRVNDLQDNLYTGGGSYSWSNRIDFMSDLLLGKSCGTTTKVNCYSSYGQGFGPFAIKFNTWDYAYFLQDDWKVAPRLTLNLGLRYEYEKLPSSIFPNANLPLTVNLPSDKNNFGPRVGFAWDVFGDGKTAVRGGYGIYYGRIINSAIAQALLQTGASGSQTQISGVRATTSYAPVFPNVLTTAPIGAQSVTFFSSHMQNPQIHQADLVVEREIAKNTVFSASYLLSLGREMPQFIDSNLDPASRVDASYKVVGGPFDGAAFTYPIYKKRLTTAYGPQDMIQSIVNSSYNAMVLQLSRRMTNGLQFQMNYTWSHAIDWGQNSITQSPTSGINVFDPGNLALEKGTSNFDLRHRFVVSAVWEPQYFKNSGTAAKIILDGWNIAPIVTISSGRPYTEYISGYNSGALVGWIGSGGSARLAPLVGRNNWRYPNTYNVDLRFGRTFKIREGQRFQAMIEAFNLFNHQQITGINNRLYSAYTTAGVTTLTYDPTFGSYNQAGATLYRERQVQFAFRYSF